MKGKQRDPSASKAFFDKAYSCDVPQETVDLYIRRLARFFELLIEADTKNRKKLAGEQEALKPRDPDAALKRMIEIPENLDDPIMGKETILIAGRFGEVVGSRSEAEPLKERLISNIKSNVVTKLNFKGVKTVSIQFCDESIAKVVIAAGLDHFNRKVIIVNANKQIKEMIITAIEGRLDLYRF